jgi:mycothiol synthase
MIGAPGSSGVPTLRGPTPAEADALQAVWEDSHLADDPGGRPRGGWSVDPWATSLCVLALDARVVGIAAVRAEPPPAEAVAARLALELDARTPELADLLVGATVDLARAADGRLVRLYVPGQAEWSMAAARRAGFVPARSIFHMLLPGSVGSTARNSVPAGVRIRSMHVGEEAAILAALNRAWASTWDFVPIRPELLERDLEGQRAGMLLAVDIADDTRILATCHAVFDPADENPDGGPRAWISNLTVDPALRGRGLGRAMLLAGLASLRERGAGSITLGVDAGDPTPLRLYQSVGFQTVSSMEAWDKSLRA